MPRLTRSRIAFAATLIFSTSFAQEGPDLGQTPSAELIAAWDIRIERDGTGLPVGSGTALEGEPIFALQCAVCHGPSGEGSLNDRLVGGHGTLDGDAPIPTIGSFWPYATTIFDYIRRAMPYLQPLSLSDDDTYALTAYLLFLNDVIGEDDVMDAESLPAVEMPNRENFIVAYPED